MKKKSFNVEIVLSKEQNTSWNNQSKMDKKCEIE